MTDKLQLDNSKAIPDNILKAWIATEALQPQTFKKQEELIPEDRKSHKKQKKTPPKLLTKLDIASGKMPWQTPAGDRKLLGVPDEQTISWLIPIAFVKMQEATELLVKTVENDGPQREIANGVSVLAILIFDEKGHHSISSIKLSSFAWATGKILDGKLDELANFYDEETKLAEKIARNFEEYAEDGIKVPTSNQTFVKGMTGIMDILKLPKEILERPRVAIRLIDRNEQDAIDILNSFYLKDLKQVQDQLAITTPSSAIQHYLGNISHKKDNILNDKSLMEHILSPYNSPPCRWPSPPPEKLVTLQQIVVNALSKTHANKTLLSVNGPPGTGKTTLLRDVVADTIFKRAEELASINNPESAFTHKETVSINGYKTKLFEITRSLKDFGIVVASSNNAAVKNVSAELPLREKVNEKYDVDYFSQTASKLLGEDTQCWGLISAILGNSKNRSEFVDTAWWNKDVGIEVYLRSITGHVAPNEEGELPEIITKQNSPKNKHHALERWHVAVARFNTVKSNFEQASLLREMYRRALQESAGIQQTLDDASKEFEEAAQLAQECQMASEKIAGQVDLLNSNYNRHMADLQLHEARKPGFILSLLGKNKAWRQTHEEYIAQSLASSKLLDETQEKSREAEKRKGEALQHHQKAKLVLDNAKKRIDEIRELEKQIKEVYTDNSDAGPAFWESAHEVLHQASPWMDEKFTEIRDEMFCEAMNLHKAFIDAAASPIKSNLSLIMSHLKGKKVPSNATKYLASLWDTLFLLVPLISTTFASVSRLFEGLGHEELGLLLVDEAGQATPQAAVGAIWRAKRSLVIGDPLQIEPVLSVPTGLIRAIYESQGLHTDTWCAPTASTQTLADTASPLMAEIGTGPDMRTIGIPLLVHRRCEEPMFSLANTIAYDNLMVSAVFSKPSAIKEALNDYCSTSAWFHVSSSVERWSDEEGAVVLELFEKLAEKNVRKPNIYLISPFKETAEKLKAFLRGSGILTDVGISQQSQFQWCNDHIGTVHTFQGKEAEAVILVLGASDARKVNTRNWAGSTPNILNVAATRAKRVLYVVGDHDKWSQAGYFQDAANLLPIVSITPKENTLA